MLQTFVQRLIKARSLSLDQHLSQCFRRYSVMVANRPLPFLLGPIIITLILSLGFLRFEFVRDADYLFTSRESPFKHERNALMEYWANSDENFHPGKDSGVPGRTGIFVMATAQDEGSVLRPEHSREVLEFMQYAKHNVAAKINGTKLFYKHVCLEWRSNCFTNQQASFIAQVFANEDQANVQVTFPKFHSPDGAEIFLGDTLGGVYLNRTTGGIVAAKAWLLVFPLRSNKVVRQFSQQWELRLAKVIENDWHRHITRSRRRPLLRLTYFHSQTLQLELEKNAERVTPKFITAFCVLLSFSIFCTMSFRRRRIAGPKSKWIPITDWSLSKPVLALAALIGAVLAVISAVGLLLMLGVPYADIVNVMPFIAVSIGIDDMFLLLASWRHSDGDNLPDRLANSLSHAAVSITITSLTDCFSFAVGTLAPLPAVTIFCSYASVAVAITFVYTLTFFLAIMVYQLRLEFDGRNSVFTTRTTPIDNASSVTTLKQLLFNMGTHRHHSCKPAAIAASSQSSTSQNSQESLPTLSAIVTEKLSQTSSTSSNSTPAVLKANDPSHDKFGLPRADRSPDFTRKVQRPTRVVVGWRYFFEDIYAPVLCHPLVRAGVLLLMLAYWTCALHSLSSVNIGFELRSLLFAGSPAWHFTNDRSRYFGHEYEGNRLNVIVHRPPRFWLAHERERFLFALEQLESTRFSTGRADTQFWLFEFQRYVKRLSHSDYEITDRVEFNTNLKAFLLTDDYYSYDVRWTPTGADMEVFRLSIRLKDIDDNRNKVRATETIRSICARYPEYNMTAYSALFPAADQFALILPQTMQNVGIALACMTVVSLLLIPSPLCSLVVAFSIVSIDIGVVGYMSLWQVNLDCISMITLAMSVGFSVDFAAHITFGYTTLAKTEMPDATPSQRAGLALGALGIPLLQGASSTLLGVLVLASVDTYIVQTCVKTVILVIVFGTVHALLFLPVVLTVAHSTWVYMVRTYTSRTKVKPQITTNQRALPPIPRQANT